MIFCGSILDASYCPTGLILAIKNFCTPESSGKPIRVLISDIIFLLSASSPRGFDNANDNVEDGNDDTTYNGEDVDDDDDYDDDDDDEDDDNYDDDDDEKKKT